MRRSTANPARAAALLCVLGSSAISATARTFPDVDDLPSRPGLPDPLVMFDGRKVTTAEQWRNERRPELVALFQHYMYGTPPPPPAVTRMDHRRKDPNALGGKATLWELTLSYAPEGTPPIELLLIVPNRRDGTPAPKPDEFDPRRVPVILGINFHGNHTVLPDPAIALPRGWVPERGPGVKDNRATDAGRGAETKAWSVEAIVDRGYALATFYHGDLDPDRPDFSDGVQPFYYKDGQTKPGPDEWGTIAAWAWGVHRVVDFLSTAASWGIDGNRIAVFGHSRNGKAALLAAALDERIALALPLQAGCGGTSPSRGKTGETVKQINDRFPHWFNDVFPLFNDCVDRLPFDQHELIALVAPRPVLIGCATEDQWSNPEGQFEMLRAADPVYRLLGAGGLEAEKMPDVDSLSAGTLGYFIRPGKHSVTPEDWRTILDFADRHLKSGR